MPWLTGTAFLHSVMMQEKRGMMKSWNVWLIFSTFMLTILGTLLTRSGVVSSVHAFAQSAIGDWFYGFILIVFAVCLFTFFKQRDHLKTENKLESLVSRESSFLFNNLILLVACFTVLWGTLFPVLSEYVQGSKVTVGAPFYNRVNIPIGLFLLFLTGIGPLLAWRSTSLRSIRRNFILPAIAMAVDRHRPDGRRRPSLERRRRHARRPSSRWWPSPSPPASSPPSPRSSSAAPAVVRTQTGKNLAASTLLLIRRNTRRYGGYIIHFGIVVMFIGIAGGAFNQSREAEMGDGDSLAVGPYTLICRTITQDSNANYDTDYALLDVYRNGQFVTQLAPEKRFYLASQTSATMVALHSTARRPTSTSSSRATTPTPAGPIIKVFLNPLIAWIWIGVAIVVFGTFIALAPNLTRTAATRARIEARCRRIAAPPTAAGPHHREGAAMFRRAGSSSAGRAACSGSALRRHRRHARRERRVALRPHRPRADVLLRLRPDSARVQPRQLPRLAGHDRRAARSSSPPAPPTWPS